MVRTTRERIAEFIREEAATAPTIADRVGLPESTVYEHLEHVALSVRASDAERFLVAPPECGDCGFADFDDLLNAPSRCPSCRCERIDPPVVQIADA